MEAADLPLKLSQSRAIAPSPKVSAWQPLRLKLPQNLNNKLVMEVVSPGKTNRALLCRYRKGRDYINKRSQYAAIGVPEYWLIDPQVKTVIVLELEGDDYRQIGTFQGIAPIVSPTFPTLTLSAEQVFQP